ncbi:hypothetical protein, partial [Pseudomonas syringae]|uniref:hypothetical protein n=1 Tax=Pseudomonas syringae TaxID=317 RepID=UPI001E34DD5E
NYIFTIDSVMFGFNSLPLTSDGTNRYQDSVLHAAVECAMTEGQTIPLKQNRWKGVQRMLPVQSCHCLYSSRPVVDGRCATLLPPTGLSPHP